MPLQGFLQFCQKGRRGEINYIFCDDEYLHKINLEYLKHDDLTDIISFTLSEKKFMVTFLFLWNVFRSVGFQSAFEEEIRRVMVHGVLHYCGYKDKEKRRLLITLEMKVALFTWNSKSYPCFKCSNVSRGTFVKDVIIGSR
jgi:rRNA maturation RNase YbeY